MTNWKHDLEHSEPHWFSEWEQTKDSIARQPGVYTVWDKNGRFLYVGTAWGKEGLRGRLSQHARGARHQDKFSVDIADRCLLRGLCRSQIDGIDAGDLKFDNLEPLAKIGNRPGFLCRKPQARDGQWAGRSVCRMAVAVTAADEPETRGFMGPPGRL